MLKVFFIILFLSSPAWATQYYVSTTGNDSNDGLSITDSHAWLTIQHAANTAVGGDIVDFLTGTYDGAIFNINDGTLTQPITFETYQGATVIVNPLNTAKDPIIIPAGTTWTNLGANTGSTAFKWASPNNIVTNSNDGIGGLMRNHSYWFALTVFPSNYFAHGPDPWYYYDAANKRVLLNQLTDPGLDEWVLVDQTINSLLVETRYMIFNGFTTEYSFDGFRVQGNGSGQHIIDDASHNIYNNITSKYNGRRGMTIDCEVSRSITDQQINNLTTFTNGEHGFKQEDNSSQAHYPYVCTNFILNHVLSHGNGYHGIQISNGGDKITVENSISYDNGINPCGEVIASSEGCASFTGQLNNGLADDVTWKNNEAYSTGTLTYFGTDNPSLIRVGMSLFSTNRANVEGNYIHDTLGPGFYGTFGSFEGSGDIFRNNIIIYSRSNFDLDIFQLGNVKFYNNTIGGGVLGAINLAAISPANIIENNAIFTVTGAPLLTYASGSTSILNYNAWYSPDSTPFIYGGTFYNFSNYKLASGLDANSINLNFESEFNNFAGRDFSITYLGAPDLRNAGDPLTSPITVPNDYAGTLRPQNGNYAIGAYEEPMFNPSINVSGGIYNVQIK